MSRIFFLAVFSCSFLFGEAEDLFRDLKIVHEIDAKAEEHLPLFYNQSMVGGYFITPSARMEKKGVVALGGGPIPPYNIYGGVVQLFERFELSANYRTFKGGITTWISEDSERIVNAKLSLLRPSDGWEWLPFVSVGGDVVVSSLSKNTQYLALTKQFHDFELTLGVGRKRLKGLFGGASWSPLRKTALPFLKDLSVLAEYDPTNYRRDFAKENKERKVRSRLNVGLGFLGWDVLQLSAMTVRGKEIAALASVRYPLGTTDGLLSKTNNPKLYSGEKHEEWAPAFSAQRLTLCSVNLFYNAEKEKTLWLKVINNTYRLERDLRERIISLLAALTPPDVMWVCVVIEADGIPAYSYCFRRKDLKKDAYTLELLAPMKEPEPLPTSETEHLYHRTKPLALFTARPRALSYFVGSEGKFKYNLGALASLEGYLFDQAFYALQLSYAIHSSDPSSRSSKRDITPRSLPEVRTDSLRYHETSRFNVEEAYLQRGWYLGSRWYGRLAAGYFEPAYVGGSGELLWYPISSPWAFGIEGALVLKRRYDGLGVFHHVRKIEGHRITSERFFGKQAFFNVHYFCAPLQLDFLMKTGRFLAKDVGSRFEVTRTFKSGFRFSVWYTLSGKKWGEYFHDRGFAFSIPLDIFLKKSSRSRFGYALAATLRNNGAVSATGKPLFLTLSDERR